MAAAPGAHGVLRELQALPAGARGGLCWMVFALFVPTERGKERGGSGGDSNKAPPLAEPRPLSSLGRRWYTGRGYSNPARPRPDQRARARMAQSDPPAVPPQRCAARAAGAPLRPSCAAHHQAASAAPTVTRPPSTPLPLRWTSPPPPPTSTAPGKAGLSPASATSSWPSPSSPWARHPAAPRPPSSPLPSRPPSSLLAPRRRRSSTHPPAMTPRTRPPPPRTHPLTPQATSYATRSPPNSTRASATPPTSSASSPPRRTTRSSSSCSSWAPRRPPTARLTSARR